MGAEGATADGGARRGTTDLELPPGGEKRGRDRAEREEREQGRILHRLLEKIGCGCMTHLLCVT